MQSKLSVEQTFVKLKNKNLLAKTRHHKIAKNKRFFFTKINARQVLINLLSDIDSNAMRSFLCFVTTL
ncbi:hypothetical protein DWU99_11755 [Dyella psychrodurans]|uniref:Uncharacterized protein n=1 Tax=Dyella psychrodurans TaxID=1927960 RepID=A0A370X496_9GAMM|nr:hypothetical protein DWU99_11755 [Dyella psychrodurans]